MYKNVIIRLAAMFALVMAMSCRELPEIGKLAGQWQITEIVYPDGTRVENPQRYYCFYRGVAQLTAPDNVKETANMVYEYPELSLEFPYVTPLWLRDWGIIAPGGSTDETRDWVQRYRIDRLDNEHLVMTTEQGARITLRKY